MGTQNSGKLVKGQSKGTPMIFRYSSHGHYAQEYVLKFLEDR